MKRKTIQPLAAHRCGVVRPARLPRTGGIFAIIPSDLKTALGPCVDGTLQPRIDVLDAQKTPLGAASARRTPRYAHRGTAFMIRADRIGRQEFTANFSRMPMKVEDLMTRPNEVVSDCRITRSGTSDRSDQIFVDEKYAEKRITQSARWKIFNVDVAGKGVMVQRTRNKIRNMRVMHAMHVMHKHKLNPTVRIRTQIISGQWLAAIADH